MSENGNGKANGTAKGKAKGKAKESAKSEVVQYALADGVATITLNRPDSLNAMTNGLMMALSEALGRVSEDESVRVVVLTGAGRGFCAGADLVRAGSDPEELKHAAAAERDRPVAPTDGMVGYFNPAMRALMDCPVPTIARVNGPAAGGGFGLALACDITIAARSAFFVATFSPRLGIVPDLGSTWSIPMRIGRARALGLTLLGDRITAEQAESWGLIWSVVDDDRLDEEVDRIGSRLKCGSPSAIVRTRRSIDAAMQNSFSEQLDLEAVHQAVLIPRNMLEGAQAFRENREPSFDGERD